MKEPIQFLVTSEILQKLYRKGFKQSDRRPVTIYDAVAWIRENFNLHVESSLYRETSHDSLTGDEIVTVFWSWYIYSTDTGQIIADADEVADWGFNSYEEALMHGLNYCLSVGLIPEKS